jgi:hypothetical protein
MSLILESAEALGAVVIAVVSVWAATIAKNAINAQHEATAKDIYRDYLKLAFDNPEFANPHAFDNPSDLNKNEKYRWFVAFMLNSCDEIARSKSRDKGWRKTILEDLRFHKDYLKSQEFSDDGGWDLYSRALKTIGDEAVK